LVRRKPHLTLTTCSSGAFVDYGDSRSNNVGRMRKKTLFLLTKTLLFCHPMFRLPTYRAFTKQLQTLFAGVMMLCYLAANVEFDSLHQLAHAHHDVAVSHNEVDESDPCHRKLYHHDFSGGCSHKAHFVASKKCGLCDHHLSIDKIFIVTDAPSVTAVANDAYAIDLDGDVRTPIHYLPARGPPAA